MLLTSEILSLHISWVCLCLYPTEVYRALFIQNTWPLIFGSQVHDGTKSHTVDERKSAPVDVDSIYPTISKVLYIPGGAGFLSSTVPKKNVLSVFGAQDLLDPPAHRARAGSMTPPKTLPKTSDLSRYLKGFNSKAQIVWRWLLRVFGSVYSPWDWNIFLHENHQNQPFM